MYGISIDYKLCNQAANDLNNIAREMSQEISYINSAKAELSSLSREYRSPNSEIEALIRLNRKLNEERQKVSLLSREIQKHVNNMRDFDDRLAKKISKNYKREIVRKFQFSSNPKDDYRVIGGTYLYPNRNVNEKIHIDPEIERYKKLLNPNYSSDFLNYFLERRIENEKNINRIKAIEASKYKYEINVRDIQRSIYSFNFTNVGGMYLEYLYNRTIGYFGEINAESLKLRGMDPKLADLGGDFMSGMLFESALTIGISGLKYINYGKNSTAGSGLGNLEKANSKPVKKLEKIDDSLLKNLDDLNEIGNDIKGAGNPITKSEYSSLRKKTPSNDIRKMVNPEGTKIDPVYGYATDVLEADHIVPMKEIVDIPGFSQLSREQQIEVLNLKDNFIGLGKSTNASKGAKNWTDWQGHSKLGEVPSDVRSNMLELESSARIALQKAIEERLKK